MKTTPAGPSSADPFITTSQIFDNSGWTVATGGSKATATAEKTNSTSATPTGAAFSDQNMQYVVIALIAVVAWKVLKKS